MKWFFTLLLMALPALAQVPPSPFDLPTTTLHSPKHKDFLDSLGVPMAKVAAAPTLDPTPPPAVIGQLTWNWQANGWTNVLFDVYHSTSPQAGPPLTSYDQIPSGFSLLISVTAPPVPVGGLAQEYFIVRVRDVVSGVVSNWNQ